MQYIFNSIYGHTFPKKASACSFDFTANLHCEFLLLLVCAISRVTFIWPRYTEKDKVSNFKLEEHHSPSTLSHNVLLQTIQEDQPLGVSPVSEQPSAAAPGPSRRATQWGAAKPPVSEQTSAAAPGPSRATQWGAAKPPVSEQESAAASGPSRRATQWGAAKPPVSEQTSAAVPGPSRATQWEAADSKRTETRTRCTDHGQDLPWQRSDRMLHQCG